MKEKIIQNLDAEPKSQSPIPIDKESKSSLGLYVKFLIPQLTIFLKWVQYFSFKRGYYQSFSSKSSYYKRVVSGLLPEALKQDSHSQDTMKFVLQRLRDRSDKEIKIIVDILKLAIVLAKNPLLVIFPTIVIIIIVAWFFPR